MDLYDAVHQYYKSENQYFPVEDCPSKKHSAKCSQCQSSASDPSNAPYSSSSNEPQYPCERFRALTRHLMLDYNFVNFQGFALYLPLYLSGPIMSFNDFLYQLKKPFYNKVAEYSRKSLIRYFVRLLLIIFLMEFLSHYLYVVAMKDAKAWLEYSTLEVLSLSYWNLKLLWLKVKLLSYFYVLSFILY